MNEVFDMVGGKDQQRFVKLYPELSGELPTTSPFPSTPMTATPDLPGGHKADGGKLEFDFIAQLHDALASVNRVMVFGAKKYASRNWEKKGFLYLRYCNAAIRHIFAYINGEDCDPETGEPHFAHAACCVLFALSHILRATGMDTRS